MPIVGRRGISGYAVAGICLALALLSVVGCEEKNSRRAALTEAEIRSRLNALRPEPPDHLIVSGQTITWQDVLASLPEDSETAPPIKETLEKAAREMSLRRFLDEMRSLVQQRLNSRISNVVLSERAKRDLGEKVEDKLNEFSQRELRRFILEEHGGNGAEADEALQKAGMNRITYIQWKKKEILARYLVESKYSRDRPITYSELFDRYNQIKDREFVREAVLQLRLIDVDVAKVRAEHPNEDPRQKAEDLRKRIDAGEDFAELAKRYSQGFRSEQGGLWRPRDPNALAAPYDVLAKKARDMEPGQVAGPIEAPGHFFIMKVEEKRPRTYRPLSEVQEEVKKDIANQRWQEVLSELDAEIRRQVDLANTSRFVDYCLERFYRQTHETDSQ